MKNEILEDIKEYAKRKLQSAYGFVGVAEGEDMAMLNSSDHNGSDFIVKIESKPE